MQTQSILSPFLQAVFIVLSSLISAQEEIIVDFQHEEMSNVAVAEPSPDAAGTLTLTPPSGLGETRGVTMSVFPNPSVDEVRIVVPEGFSAGTLLIFDSFGRTVTYLSDTGPGGMVVPRGSLPPGMYRAVFCDSAAAT